MDNGLEEGRWDYPYKNAFTDDGPLVRLAEATADSLGEVWGRHRLESLIDLGSGPGLLAFALLGRLPSAPRCLLIDKDLALLRRAGETAKAKNVEVAAVAADLDEYPLAGELAGPALLLVSHVLYYLDDWRTFLSRVVRLTRQERIGAALIIRTKDSSSFTLRHAVRRALGEPDPPMLHSGHVASFLDRRRIGYERRRVGLGVRLDVPAANADIFRESLIHEPRLRDLLQLLCHCDPLQMNALLLEVVRRILATDTVHDHSLTLTNDVYIINSPHT